MTQIGYYEVSRERASLVPRSWSPSLRRLAMRVLCAALVLLAAFEQWRLLRRLLVRHMNADHALLWLAARDWSLLQVHEPTFFGQSYGVTFEAIPVALLHALGVPYHYALPVALFSLAWGAWLWLAASAFRRGLPLAGLCALAAPSLLPVDHWIIVGVIGTGVGRLLAALAAGLVLRGAATRARVLFVVALAGLAVAFDSASALLAGPALSWAGWQWARVRRLWLPAALGLLAPAAWLLLKLHFDHAHPDHDMHWTWSYAPELRPLLDNLRHPGRLFGSHTLELWRLGALIPLCLCALLGAALHARAWREAAAVGCVIAQLTYLALLDKSLDDMGTLWYPAARMTLAAPMTLWFTAVITLRACHFQGPGWLWLRRHALLLLGLLVLASAGVRALRWERRLAAIEHRGVQPEFLQLSRPWDEIALCDEAQRQAAALGTHIVAMPTEGTANYACPALYPGMLTAYPSYERRFWVLDELAHSPERRMILWGRGAAFCGQRRARKLLERCTPVAGDRAVALVWKDRDPLRVLNQLGFHVRPFGPGCHPKQSETCGWWSKNYGR